MDFLKEKLKNSKILKKLCFYTVHKGYKSNQIRSKMLMRIFITLGWEESFEQCTLTKKRIAIVTHSFLMWEVRKITPRI